MSRAFTLIELSIVLVILALLVGGVLAGQSLVRAAELRSVTVDLSRFKIAVGHFQDKYNAIPGDMNNATSYWGAADGGDGVGSDCGYTVSTGTATCNGNGNEYLENIANIATVQLENFRFWQHLANAKLIEGQYTGTGDPSLDAWSNSYGATIRLNVPGSKIKMGFWAVETPCSTSDGWCDNSGIAYGNSFRFSSTTSGPSTLNYAQNIPILPPDESASIDRKIDDGMPYTGTMLARGRNGNCATSNTLTDLSATYLLNVSGKACGFIFPKAF